MNRRDSVLAVIALGVATPYAFSQQTGKLFSVGFLATGGAPPDHAVPASLRQAMRDLGYVEGKNIGYTGRWADAKVARLPALAAEMVKLNVDAIVTLGAPATAAAKNATASIPIVMTGPAGDAVKLRMIASLARPGGNITGVSDDAGPLSAKRMEILKEAVPKARRIAVIWNADDEAMTMRYSEIDNAARMLRVVVQPFGVRNPEDFGTTFNAMTREPPDALFLVADALTVLNRKRVIDFAGLHRIPAMYEFAQYVHAGGLMSYGPSGDDVNQIIARLLDRIFKGTKPSDIPVEQPTRYYLTINLNTAHDLGLTIPESLAVRADELIQ